MLRKEGDRNLSHPPEVVRRKLSDPQFLVDCIPDVHETKEVTANHALCVLRPGFAFIRGSLEVNLQVLEVSETDPVRLSLTSKGIGSSSEAEATLAVEPVGEGSKVHWVVEVGKLGGLLKAVPKGLISGAAEKVINDAWERIETRFNEKKK